MKFIQEILRRLRVTLRFRELTLVFVVWILAIVAVGYSSAPGSVGATATLAWIGSFLAPVWGFCAAVDFLVTIFDYHIDRRNYTNNKYPDAIGQHSSVEMSNPIKRPIGVCDGNISQSLPDCDPKEADTNSETGK